MYILAYPVKLVNWKRTKVQFCNETFDVIKKHKDKISQD